jgi:phospholipid/cholesterol/gamma-HCH transport system substrate-binding protein
MRKAVGIFFFLGILFLAGLTFWVDDEMSILRGGGSYYFIRLPSAEGLQEGSQVWLAGMVAGRVTKVSLLEDGTGVRAVFTLKKGFRLREDSEASLPSTSLLSNGRSLTLTLGKPGAREMPLREEPPGVEVTRVKATYGLDSVVEKASATFDSLKEAGPAIKDVAESLRNVAKKVDAGEGTLGKLVNDPKLYNDLSAAAVKIEEGMASLKNIAIKIESGEGTLPKLINDPAVYNDIRRAADKLANVADKLDSGQGTLGKLINDDSLYNEARRFLKETREAVEDAREQAPVTAFSSMLFSALQ